MQDRYATLAPSLSSARATAAALYSPTQAAFGAFLGGPVGLIYFLHHNFVVLEDIAAARKCLIYGVLLILALLVLLSIFPDRFPSTPFTIFYIVVARFVAEKFQLTKQAIADSPDYTFKSNGNVFGMGLACLVGSVIVIVGPIFLLISLGLVR